jgi:uncharacterized protein YjbI with pentapeptide repeats
MTSSIQASPQQAKFDAASAAHRAFLALKPGGKRMDAHNEQYGAINARGRNLATAVLPGANFVGAQMQDCDLSLADLFGASFSRADLSGGRMRRVKACGARFDGAVLLDADLREADFRPGQSVQWSGIVGKNADQPTEASAAENAPTGIAENGNGAAVFTNADLRGANLGGARAPCWPDAICEGPACAA